MTLPSGQLSLSGVNGELGLSTSSKISLSDTNVRLLAGKSTGQIGFGDLRGKTWAFSFATSVAGGQINVRSAAVAAGWNQVSPVTCTINSNSYSNSSGTPTVLITGNFPAGLRIVIGSSIYVVGRGGTGGNGGSNGVAGTSAVGGGTAISVTSYSGGTLVFENNGFIGGGGGGGGGGGSYTATDKSGTVYYGGGGGGGGAGFGSGGAAGTGANGNGNAGGTGNISAAGGGGAGSVSSGNGGSGGGLGTGGSNGGASGSGAAGGTAGGAGAATTGTIVAAVVWAVTGTRYGTIS
jgi:hypothetical protein